MGLCPSLQPIASAHRRPATLATQLQLAPPSRQLGRTASCLQTRPQQKQPAETPHLAGPAGLDEQRIVPGPVFFNDTATTEIYTQLGMLARHVPGLHRVRKA